MPRELKQKIGELFGRKKENRKKPPITLYHIGGEGEYGPAMPLVDRFGADLHLVVFEARTDSPDEEDTKIISEKGSKTTIVRTCVDETNGHAPFHINKFPLSSSLLPVSPVGATEVPGYDWCRNWGENAELDRIINVETQSLDHIVANRDIPAPDVLSMDVQGAEMRLLRGGKKVINDNVLAVVTEVEFFEIYDRQGLFDDQMRFLGDMGFRLVDFFNVQNWYPDILAGRGFMTVAEALFIRYVHEYPREKNDGRRCFLNLDDLRDEQIIKLVAIAFAFNLKSYSYKLCKMVREQKPELFREMESTRLTDEPVRLFKFMEDNKDKSDEDFRYFIHTHPV